MLTKWHPDGRLKSNARTMWRRKVREAFEEEWGKVKRIKIKPSDVEPYDPQNRVFKAGEHTFKRHSIGPDWIAPTKAPRKDTLLDTRVPGNEGIENAQRMLVRKRAHLALLEKRLCDAQNQEVVQECEETKPTLEREIKEWEKELEELLRRHKQAPKDAASVRSQEFYKRETHADNGARDPPSQFSVNSPFSASRFSDSLNTLKPSSLVIDGAGTLAKGGVIVGGLEGARRLLQGVTSWGNIGKVLEF